MSILKPVVLSIFLLASCNKQRTYTVTLPHNYTGAVSISCVSSADADTAAQIVSQPGDSGASDVACPTHTSDLHVLRDGQEVPAQNVNWVTTGDKIVSGLTFTVQ